jgi:hypothetical protein
MVTCAAVVALCGSVGSGANVAASPPPPPTFTTFPLSVPLGSTEPAIAIAADGTTAVTALDAGPDLADFNTWVWKGAWNSEAALQGSLDGHVGKRGLGGADADIDIGSTGTIHAASLVVFFNAHTNKAQLGVYTVSCAAGDTSDAFTHCTGQVIDTAGTDRPWITSDGPHVYLSYRDAGVSSLVRIVRSDDDGLTWTRQGSPTVASGRTTATQTYNNFDGPIVVDPVSHDVYVIIAAGTGGWHKAQDTAWNNIFVARSRDLGRTWTTTLVYHAPIGTDLFNIMPALAIDPVTRAIYAGWSDGSTVSTSESTDNGVTWSAPRTMNTGAAATTAIFPWIAAHDGTVDVVFYGSTGVGRDDESGVWNTFMSKSTDAGATFTQTVVSPHAIRVGALQRHLFADLFEVAINPQNGKAAIAYADSTLASDGEGNPIPQTVLAFEQ